MKEYKPFNEYAEKSYQEKITEDIYLNINEYSPIGKMKRSWTSNIQLSFKNDLTINIEIFSYRKKDFKKMIKDAKEIIKKLTINK